MSSQDAATPLIPKVDGSSPRMLVVRAPYYKVVIEGLTGGVERVLSEAGASFETLDVAGAYELPQAIRLAVRGNRIFDGFVALGCIIRGETDHYEFLSRSTMQGLMDVSLKFGLCIGVGLLTCDTLRQAQERSSFDNRNKGTEAAVAALLQVSAGRRFGLV